MRPLPRRPRNSASSCRNRSSAAIIRQRHRAVEFIELLRQLDRVVPLGQVIHLILDPVRMHCSAAVAVFAYYHPGRFPFHWLPRHASWLSFVEAWFAILSKQCLQRRALADFTTAARAITDFVATYNAHHAKPFTWRKGIRFYQRRKDKLAAVTAAAADAPTATEYGRS